MFLWLGGTKDLVDKGKKLKMIQGKEKVLWKKSIKGWVFCGGGGGGGYGKMQHCRFEYWPGLPLFNFC